MIEHFKYFPIVLTFVICIAAAGANYPRPGLMPRDPALALHPAELLGRPYADMAVHHEQLQRHLMMERDRFPPHASLVAHHEEYLRFVFSNK